uniref:Nuclease HARBI1 n=1 Tax=Cajanus cajan TaxID=3821 RepID=A0A151RQ86_CAJCA|nr:Putative nuclease HARBI1 [Cajanus cajan]
MVGHNISYFKCVGALDGTHIPVTVSLEDRPKYRNRKGDVSTNVLAACGPDLRFIYVLPGWEGSAGDSRVLRDALRRQNKLEIPAGKYFLVDAGYTNGPGFLAPYRGTRYHLNEWIGNTPQNFKELFNLRHSSARNAIERSFGILKKRWKNLKGKRKMTERNNEETRSYFSWNLEMERVLADVLRDQRSLGNKSDGAWKRVAYNAAAVVLSTNFKIQVTWENVKNRIKLWRSWYGVVSDILSQSGFDWDGTKHMITVDNENAWNEYVNAHKEARQFRFKVIANWDDIVDLCAKDRATGHGAETAMDADEVMSREINEGELGLEDVSDTIYLDEPGSTTQRRGQSSASTSTQSQRRKMGEKDGIANSLKEVAESLKRLVQAFDIAIDEDAFIQEVLAEAALIPNLNQHQWTKAVKWLSDTPKQLAIVKALPIEKKAAYVLTHIS